MTATGQARHEPLAAPSGIDAVLLALAITGVSFSGPIMAATVAPALAIAFWRNAFGATATSAAALLRTRRELLRLPARSWKLAGCAGVALAAHFATWVPSVTMTSVASSVALVSTQTVFTAVIAHLSGRTLPRLAWIGVVLATVATALVTGADLGLSARSVAGDLLAIVGGLAAAIYVTIGSSARTGMSTTSYTAICYTACAGLLLGACLVGGVQLGGYPADTWLKIAGVTACAQLLGHTLINVVLRSTSATVVSAMILLEVPGSAVVAFVWLQQRPAPGAVPGLLLLLLGLLLVARAREPDAVVESTE